MNFKKGEYIIKARDLDIEIKNKHKYIKHLIVLEVLIVIIALLQLIASNNSSLLIFLMPFIIYPVVTILEYNWSLKIINRTIYIKNHSGSHKIQYKDLLSINVLYRGRGNTERVLEVKYLKKNKIIKVILPFSGELDSKIYEICKSFITNEEIENGKQIEYGYFDIREEVKNGFIEKKKEINRTGLLIISLVFCSIVCILMLIKLFQILK